MIIKNATLTEIYHALELANGDFGDNLSFKSFEPEGRHYRVTLAVKSSRGPGAHTSFRGRHTASACWHAHARFFDFLPEDAEIISSYYGKKVMHPGEKYEDFEIGSMMYPMMASEACEC